METEVFQALPGPFLCSQQAGAGSTWPGRLETSDRTPIHQERSMLQGGQDAALELLGISWVDKGKPSQAVYTP